MARIDKKLEHIKLQHEILELLRKDNGVSAHFDYHVNLLSDDLTVKLNLLTYNPRHNEYMLLHTTQGASSVVCLNKMLAFLKSSHAQKTEYSFTVKWRKKEDSSFVESYFRATDKEEVERKFLHEKDPADYDFEIRQNPVA